MAKEELINLQRLEDYSADMFRDANVLKRNTLYALNNVVCKGLIVLKCILAGTTNTTSLSLSGVSVGDELTDGTAKWKVISINGYGTGGGTGAGLEDWESNHDYAVDDIYVYEGEIYKTLIAFTSGSTEDSRTKVNNIVPSVWVANTAYTAGDIIEHTDVTTLKKVYYNVTANFTSGATFEVTAEMQELQITEEYVPNPLTKQQVKNLINNFVPSGSGTDPIFYNDSPIGTIIAYMGITAPKDYLACDGQTYNIVDYKELAEYIKVQFGSYNYFGGDGITTFAVPDLRGEFLRGTGTNSHSNQGSGASVGTHQDGTEIPNIYYNSGNLQINALTGQTEVHPTDTDHSTIITNRTWVQARSNSGTDTDYENIMSYTSRPTNTSVLYCIKYNTSVLSTPENNYSTEEQRIGTWIDGKPLYQKVLKLLIGELVIDQWKVLATLQDAGLNDIDISSPVISSILCYDIYGTNRWISTPQWTTNAPTSSYQYGTARGFGAISIESSGILVISTVTIPSSQISSDNYMFLKVQYTKTTD